MHRTLPEVALVLCCGRLHLGFDEKDRIRNIAERGVDWGKLQDFASAHGMASLVFKGLKAAGPIKQANILLDACGRWSEENTLRNIVLLKETIRVLRLLASINLFAAPFKGQVLGERLFGDQSVRKAGDIDILVHQKDAMQAIAVLLENGYQTDKNISPRQWETILRLESEYHFGFFNPKTRCWLELHWNISWPELLSRSSFDRMLAGATETQVLGAHIKHFQERDLLILYCIHGYKHLWYRIYWIWELAWLLHREQGMDWSRLMAEAADAGVVAPLFSGLILASELFGVRVPEKILEEAYRDAKTVRRTGRIKLHLLRGKTDWVPSLLPFLVFRMERFHGLPGKIWWLLRFIVTPNHRDVIDLDLDYSRRYLYYFSRPLRIALSLARSLASR